MVCWAKSPYRETLALDADTLVLDDIGELFSLLTRFDLALCHGHNRVESHVRSIKQRLVDEKIPYAFSPVQAGLILYRASPAVAAFFKRLIERYKNTNHWDDQASFRELLWESDLAFYILPREYNFNSVADLERWAAYGFVEAKPKIFHYTRHKSQDVHKLVESYIGPKAIRRSGNA